MESVQSLVSRSATAIASIPYLNAATSTVVLSAVALLATKLIGITAALLTIATAVATWALGTFGPKNEPGETNRQRELSLIVSRHMTVSNQTRTGDTNSTASSDSLSSLGDDESSTDNTKTPGFLGSVWNTLKFFVTGGP